MKVLKASKSNPPVGAIIVSKVIKSGVKVEWGKETSMDVGDGVTLHTSASIIRYFARSASALNLYTDGAVSRTLVDHWLTFSIGPISCGAEFKDVLKYLNESVAPNKYLVGDAATAADYAVFGALFASPFWRGQLDSKETDVNLVKWYRWMEALPEVKSALGDVPKDVIPKAAPLPKAASPAKGKGKKGASPPPAAGGGGKKGGKGASPPPAAAGGGKKGGKGGGGGGKGGGGGDKPKQTKDEGKFVDLPNAEMGKVVTRFPPEASGYLHIGHAKAAMLNQHYRDHFKGKLILRFDDTNPAKEKEEFEEVILHDLKLLQVKYDHFSRTSDHFETMLNYCEKLIKDGKAYVDDSDAETMRNEREARTDGKNRSNPPEKNLKMWEEMKKASEVGQRCAVRAKMNMQSDNGAMRDPTIYRCKPEPHPSTGTKYKVYPTYDFACPIVDSIEGVTHALRTTEYMDRDEQFFWFIDALGLRKPTVYAYSRLSMTNTVMSKRKLTWFAETGQVDGWDDPRFPTVRGVLRRGLTIDALKQFILAQGSSRSVVFMEWDKIWAMNKKVIDPVAPRFTAVSKSSVVVNISGAKEESVRADKHPKDASIGQKTVWRSNRVLIDAEDAEALKEGENATFVNWGNIMIKKVNRAGGKVSSVDAELNLDNTDYKKTLKVTWLAETDKAPFTPTTLVYYDHIITKPVLEKDDDFKDFIGKDTKFETEAIGDPELKSLKKGDIIQIQRKGFFIVDAAYKAPTPNTCKPQAIKLISIPDGTPGSYGPPGKALAPAAAAPAKGKGGKKGGAAQPAKAASPASAPAAGGNAAKINTDIIAAGDKVRQLKSDKADKTTIGDAVKVLLDLKASYQAATGQEWKPGSTPPAAAAPAPAAAAGGGSGDAAKINTDIIAAGDKVRQLKSDKANKATIGEAVKALLDLKAKYKAATGQEWKPGCTPPAAAAPAPSAGGDAASINESVIAAGDKVRQLKSDKADKATIGEAVKVLLDLKAKYKEATGKEWKPGCTPPAAAPAAAASSSGGDLNAQIEAQGNVVRKLKGEKADKASIDAAVKVLLELKAKFKAETGSDWKPGKQPKKAASPPAAAAPAANAGVSDLEKELGDRIVAQGDLVRKLKTDKADKADVDANIQILLALKEKFKEKTGQEYKPPGGGGGGGGGARKPKEKKEKQKKEKTPQPQKAPATEGGKKVTRLGMESRKGDSLADWYSEIIVKAELLEYYDVSGCYILRPWSYSIWEAIQAFFDAEIKKLGVQNCYFPIFVSKAALEREKEHIADFAPEVAWVTKSGDSDLAEPIAVRPTSETVMYPAYAKWIQSHRDLPLKLNQWNNVVRWEFKHPQPFLRTREFLWQEGHSAFADKPEAEAEVMDILRLYKAIYEDLLAIPTVPGRKTEKEKFAGGDYTTTVEAYISSAGRAIQGATSHHLGQNFSKMFEVVFEDPSDAKSGKKYVYQNSWGITTRTIGVLIMVHGDDKGLVLPPNVASVQVVIVPCGITASLKDEDRKELYKSCEEYEDQLKALGVRVRGDYRENYSPGWKFNHWELKGVPIRLELGPRDVKSGEYVAVRRDTGVKLTLKKANAATEIKELLSTIQKDMFAKAKKELDANMDIIEEWKDFVSGLEKGHLLQAPFCGDKSCEEKIKEESQADIEVEPGAPSMGAKSLCIPFDQPKKLAKGAKCVFPCCKNKPMKYTLFGRSY